MDEQELERQYRWERLRDLALTQVRRGYRPECILGCIYERLLQILYLPSFDDYVGWEVFEVRCGDPVVSYSCLAQRTAWKQNEDGHKFDAPAERLTVLRRKFLKDAEPTFACASVMPDLERIRAAVSRLAAIRVPLQVATPDFIGADGDTFELIIGHSYAQVTLRWWEEAPAEWREIKAVTRELLEYLGELAQPGEVG